MNLFEKIIYNLQATMTEPTSYGWFHIMWVILTFLSIFVLYKLKNKYSEKQLKFVLLTYGIIAFTLELLKQISWSFNYVDNNVFWDYQWYAAPFQLCTTPIFVSLICGFLKKGKVRTALLSYMAFITILGSFMTIVIPDSCFVEDILVNVHTMWLHCGSFVVSVYLLINEIKINKKNLINSFIVFVIFVIIAQTLNVVIYNLGILNGETFNMFYISPYFESTLPVYSIIYNKVPFIVFLLFYMITIMLGGLIVYLVSYLTKKITSK